MRLVVVMHREFWRNFAFYPNQYNLDFMQPTQLKFCKRIFHSVGFRRMKVH